jgi:hypothetical protein
VRTAPPITDPMKNWGAPPVRVKRNLQPRLYGSISAVRKAELAGRNERPLPAENYELFNPSTKEVVQHAKPIQPPTKPLSSAKSVDMSKPQKTSLSIAAHTKFSRGIPLTCPYWKEGGECPSEPQCFFLHEDNVRTASYGLYDQAEVEARQTGRFQYKFGFSGPQKVCEYWSRGGCTRPDDECWHAHWKTGLTAKPQLTCWFFARGSCRNSAENCSYLHQLREKVAPSPHGEQNMTCMRWVVGDCPFSASECPLLHTESRRESMPTKIKPNCKYWKRGCCRYTAEQCKYLHTKAAQIASAPTSKAPPSTLHNSSATINMYLGNPHSQPAQAGAIRDLDSNCDETRLEDEDPPQEFSAAPKASAKPIKTTCRLHFLGFAVEIMMELPHHISKIIAEEGGLSLKLNDWALAEHLESWAGLKKSKALADGPVVCNSKCPGLDTLKTHLRNHLTGGVVCLPSIIVVFFPGPMDDWKFLQPATRSQCQFYFHVAPSGNFVPPQADQVGAATTSYEYLSARLKMNSDEFFLWGGEIAARRRVFILANEAWAAEKDVITRYFRETNSDVLSNWHAFMSWKSTTITGPHLKGVLIIHPEFQLAQIQRIPGFRSVLFRSFNVFRIGTSLDTNEFVCEHLFAHGSCIYISNGMYEDHPEKALEVINGLEGVNRSRVAPNRTWRLAARPNLGTWLSELLSKDDGKTEK